MFKSVFIKLRDWIVFHQTYSALKQLDPHLRRDLGLEDADLQRISRKVMHEKGPINLFVLREEDEDFKAGVQPSVPLKAPSACAPARRDVQETQQFPQRPYPA